MKDKKEKEPDTPKQSSVQNFDDVKAKLLDEVAALRVKHKAVLGEINSRASAIKKAADEIFCAVQTAQQMQKVGNDEIRDAHIQLAYETLRSVK
jgi:hypothetical protein